MQGPVEISKESRSTSMGRQKQYQKATLVRLTDDEYRQLTERAKLSRLSLSRFLVVSTLADKAVTNEDKERTDKRINQRDWAITQVVRVGNDLNQIARQRFGSRHAANDEALHSRNRRAQATSS